MWFSSEMGSFAVLLGYFIGMAMYHFNPFNPPPNAL
jgi:hypothetical protein